MSGRADTLARASARSADAVRGLRVALSPHLFRGMLIGMAAVAIAIHRTTGSRALAWRFAKARARNLTRLLGVGVTMTGLERLDAAQSYVFAPNHQSLLDILVLLGWLPGATRFAAKRELWRYRVVGGVLDTLGMIPVDRDDPAQAIEALGQAAGERQSVVVFPEGTRSRTGALLPFKRGAFVLAITAGLPVVPVACRGTRRLMPSGSRLTVVPGEVEIVIGEPIPTAGLGYGDRDALADRVRAGVERQLEGG